MHTRVLQGLTCLGQPSPLLWVGLGGLKLFFGSRDGFWLLSIWVLFIFLIQIYAHPPPVIQPPPILKQYKYIHCHINSPTITCWTTDHYHPCSNPGVGISEGCFIFHFVSLHLEVAHQSHYYWHTVTMK